MPHVRAWFCRLFGLFRKNHRNAEMAEEMEQHVDLLTERNIAAGMPPDAARNAALREFGGVEQIKETAREQRIWRWADEFVQDVRFGARMLWRSRAFSFLAILCLTLGIGTNAAVLSWVEGILIRPYPAVAHQDRMFAFNATTRGEQGYTGLSYPDFLDYEKNSTLFESFIVDRIIGTTLSVGDRAERAAGAIVSANYFDALGVRPILGRGFRPEEGTGRNAHPVTVIGYKTWKDRYGGDPNIVGRTQMLNGVQHTIIGVTPEKYHGTFVGNNFSFWVPLSMQETFDTAYKLEDRGARWIEGFAFLKPGVTRQQANAELHAISQRLEKDYPETNRGHDLSLSPLWRTPFNQAESMSSTLAITMAVVFFVLLIACANVSNLLLARSLLRRHEMTMRLALGAGRPRLIKQLFTEGFLLALIAAAGGIAVAYWCRNALVLTFPSAPAGIVIDFPGQIDWRVLVLSVAICVGATMLFALVPAIQASHVDLSGALKTEGGGGIVGSASRSGLRSSLVLVQVSLSFVLLAGTGLLLQSLQRMQNTSPGFSTDVVVSGADLVSAGYDLERAKAFNTQLLDRVREMPGVESAALSRLTPFSFVVFSSAPLAFDNYQPAPEEQLSSSYLEISEDYFKTLDIPIVAGREFQRTDDENAAPVAVINETMAAKYWPGKDPIGQRLKVRNKWLQIVGVAKVINYENKTEQPKTFFYVPMRQNFSKNSALLVRTRETPAALSGALAREMHALDPNLAPTAPFRVQEQVDRKGYTQRLAATLVGIFGAMALFLAAIGLYAVMSYSVSQSTRELGMRIALGADARDILRLVLSRGLRLTVAGIFIGGVAALLLTRLMGDVLYKVSPRDPIAFFSALSILVVVALLACLLPARRATRIDPVRALRA